VKLRARENNYQGRIVLKSIFNSLSLLSTPESLGSGLEFLEPTITKKNYKKHYAIAIQKLLYCNTMTQSLINEATNT